MLNSYMKRNGLAEKIIGRIRAAINQVYEKYEDEPLIEEEGIMDGFEDIITDYYEENL